MIKVMQNDYAANTVSLKNKASNLPVSIFQA